MNGKLLQILPKPIKIDAELMPYVTKLPRPKQMILEETGRAAKKSFKKMLNTMFWVWDIGSTVVDALKFTQQELDQL